MEEIKIKNKKTSMYFLCALLFAFILKYLIYGFKYFPVLDDYIQYGGYPMYNDLSHVLFNIGTISSRPLAALLDVVFWGSLWKIPHLMLIFSCVFHFLSCVFFYKTAEENGVYLSPLFAVFYLFFPLGSEGSMWISASSRIVLGLFFASLAALSLTKYQSKGKIIFFIGFLLSATCSFSLYETSAVFCFLVCALVIINNRKKIVLPSISLCALLFALLLYMKLGQNIGGLGSRVSESSFLLIFTQLSDFFSQLFEILTNGVYKLTVQGFTNGLLLLLEKGIVGIIYILTIFAVCVILGKIYIGATDRHLSKQKTIFLIISGVLLFCGGFAPNLVSNPVWITYRTMFIPLIGLYLVFDMLFVMIKNKSVKTILLMVLLFIFTISSVNEYDTYKRTNELDTQMLDLICSSLPESVTDGNQEVAVLLDDVPQAAQVSPYKDHVKTVFHADWALTGAVRSHTKNIKIKRVIPIVNDVDIDISDSYVIDLRKKE